MNPHIDIELLLSFKNHPKCINLDDDVLSSILNSFTNNEYKNKKYKIQNKKVKSIFKNPKIKIMKDKITNKVNLILNKLTENNIDNLVSEFNENIKITNHDDYNEFLKTVYYKILSEVNFIKNYLNFFIIITEIYKNIYDYNIKYFYLLIENKFKLDYENDVNDEFIFLTEIEDETKRINNLILIKELIKLNYFVLSFQTYIENYLLGQKEYLADITVWFKDDKITDEQINKIKLLIDNTENFRDKVLLENLVNNNGKTNKIIFKKQNVYTEKPVTSDLRNTNKTINSVELLNILEEYLFIESLDSIENYIQINCTDAITKNKFCEFIIQESFKLTNDEYKKILLLFKILIKNKSLFKSNLSRGLLNIYSSSNFNNDKFKSFLTFLKSLGITKGIEHIMQKYSIDIYI